MPGQRNLSESVFSPEVEVVRIVLDSGLKGRYIRKGETFGLPMFEWELEEEARA